MLLFSLQCSFAALCSKLIDIYIAPLTLTAEGQSMKLAGVSLQLKRLREIMVGPTERWGCMRGSSGHPFTPTVLSSHHTAAVPHNRGQGRRSSMLNTGGPFTPWTERPDMRRHFPGHRLLTELLQRKQRTVQSAGQDVSPSKQPLVWITVSLRAFESQISVDRDWLLPDTCKQPNTEGL